LQAEAAHGELLAVAAPLAKSLGICAQIEAEPKPSAALAVALDAIRHALELLQQPSLQVHSGLVERATAGVAQALAALHELERTQHEPPRSSTDTTMPSGGQQAPLRSDEPRVEAALGAHSATNFYRGLSDDVLQSGGLFVATYVLPEVGQRLRLAVSLPGGFEFEAVGVVAWTSEPREGSIVPGAPPGFGARLSELS